MSRSEDMTEVPPALDTAPSKVSEDLLYTFDCRRSDGSAICLEARELSTDERARAWAGRLLAEHESCSQIEIFDDERFVGTIVRRDP
jgi:hypothetical protein